MKKMKYNVPQIEVVRFELEEILSEKTMISNPTMGKDTAAVGKFTFGSSNTFNLPN